MGLQVSHESGREVSICERVTVMADKSISFEIKNSLAELCGLHQKLEQFGKDIGLASRVLFIIELVLEEVCTNIITYGYADSGEHWIHIDLQYQNDVLLMQVEDDGIPFNPAAAEGPDLESALERRKIGGLGIHLMKTFMNEIDYRRKEDKNILTIRKRCGNDDSSSENIADAKYS